jgi:hypothetical protein
MWFFSAYASEQGQNAGVTQLIVHWLGDRLRVPLTATITLEHLVDVFVIGTASVIVFAVTLAQSHTCRSRYTRTFRRDSLDLNPSFSLVYNHLLSMGTCVIGPVAVSQGITWSRSGRCNGMVFTATVLHGYFFNSLQDVPIDWTPYYRLVYWPVMVA